MYGPTQRLLAAGLSGWGKAVTSKSIRHVFLLGGAPFFDLYQFLRVMPQQRSRLSRFTVCSGHHGSVPGGGGGEATPCLEEEWEAAAAAPFRSSLAGNMCATRCV